MMQSRPSIPVSPRCRRSRSERPQTAATITAATKGWTGQWSKTQIAAKMAAAAAAPIPSLCQAGMPDEVTAGGTPAPEAAAESGAGGRFPALWHRTR